MATLLTLVGIPVLAALMCAGLLVLLRPWLETHAMARPVARSLHRQPTPQGGGLGVVVATFVATWSAAALGGPLTADAAWPLALLTASAALLLLFGLFDDIRGLPALPRLLIQALALAPIIAVLAEDQRIIAGLPLWIERLGLLLAGLWFVNLVNFMDGADWMTVAQTVPIAAAVAVLGLIGAVTPPSLILALALLGAMLGFAPFNRPVAKLFLGDAGSLPIGLILAWLLLELALRGQIAAAVLLPLYSLADATITLMRRAVRGEKLWEAHRGHFYQQAIGAGMAVSSVVALVFATNIILAGLAIAAVVAERASVSLSCLLGGAIVVGGLLRHLARR
ncbi:MAG: glycosyl transferase [Hyphomicrobiales bacterium]|nr:glycosyl transferase [Hyphomicrobiales bacterium]